MTPLQITQNPHDTSTLLQKREIIAKFQQFENKKNLFNLIFLFKDDAIYFLTHMYRLTNLIFSSFIIKKELNILERVGIVLRNE